jgi:hypothetical protein
MDDRTHLHGAHTHGGRVHANVDPLANALGRSARLAIRLDRGLMETLGVAADAIARVIFTKVAAPTIADVQQALEPQPSAKQAGENNG